MLLTSSFWYLAWSSLFCSCRQSQGHGGGGQGGAAGCRRKPPFPWGQARSTTMHTLPPSLARWGLMALTSLWKILCCSTWWSTSGRSVPKLWLLSLSWEGGRAER